MNTDLATLRDMLQPTVPHPTFIVASPKYPSADTPLAEGVYDSRTFGNHLGILGLISAYGSMWGEAKGIELISAQHSPPDLLHRELNLCLIGSAKVNQRTGEALKEIQEGEKTRLSHVFLLEVREIVSRFG